MLNLKNIKKKNKLGRTGPGCHLLRMRFQAFPPSPIKSNLYPVSKVTLFFFSPHYPEVNLSYLSP